ncbi:hypothetical protein ACXYMX_08965 [Sporosarcina sp. CAU 1771]
MFTSDWEIKGKHAAYMKQLVEDNKLFNRNLDVYMTAPLIGYVNGRQEEADKSDQYSEVIRKIGTEALLKEKSQLNMIYRLIMLLDNTDNLTIEEQVNRAFRHDSNDDLKEKHKANMEVFETYVRGGISILYEKVIQNVTVPDDYFKNISNYIKEYAEELKGISEEKAENELNSILNN